MQPSTQPEQQRSITRARPWWVALAAAATMLVLIGALDNPSVTRSLLDNFDIESFGGRLRASISTFSWDFSRLSNDFGRLYLANVLMDVAIIVLVFLLVAVISAGSGSFGRTFLGTWTAVLAACVVGGYVRSAVVDPKFADPNTHGKATAIFFSVSSPGASLLFAAILFGLVAALVAAVVAVATRRHEVVTTPAPYSPGYSPAPYSPAPSGREPSEREPWSAPPAAVPGPVATPSPWSDEAPAPDSGRDTGDTDGADNRDADTHDADTHDADTHDADTHDADRTTQLPAVDTPSRDDSDDHTRELPRTERES